MPRTSIGKYNTNSNSQTKVMVFLYSLVVLIMISPPLYNIPLFRYIMLFSMIIWVGLHIFRKRGKISAIGALVVIFIVLTLVKTLLDTGTPINARITKIYYYCYFVVVYFAIENEMEYYKKTFWLFMIICPIWLVISIYFGLTINNLFRGLSGSGLYDTELYSSLGVVGYDYIYSIVICLPVFLGLLHNRRSLSKTQNMFIIINLALNILLIVIANYGLAFFTMFICLIVFLLNKGYGITPAKIVLFSFASAIIIAFMINSNVLFSPLLKLLSGTYYENKVFDLYSSINTGSVFGRSEIWTNAIKEFVSNPIWGNGFKHNVNTHSEILYALVYYGIIIGGLEVVILFYPFKFRYYNTIILKRVRLAVIVGFIIISLFDPVGSTLGPVFVTVYGISKYYLINQEIEKTTGNGESYDRNVGFD